MWSGAARRLAVPDPAPDPTVYPDTDDMGEPTLQTFIVDALMPLVERWLAVGGPPTFVGRNTFIYWKQYNATERLAPDLYVLPGTAPKTQTSSWKTWETGQVPSFALEIVATDVDKDYIEGPEKYDDLGVKELVVFDPAYADDLDERFLWQVFRRVGKRGLVRVDATNGDRVRSRVLGCFLRAVGEGSAVRIRLGTGPHGDTLFPTFEEAERATREKAEARAAAERTAREKAEAKADAAHAAREQAEARAATAHAAREQAEARAAAAHAAREQADTARMNAEADRDAERAAREKAEAELRRLRAAPPGKKRRG
jgi:hypothetical protein